MINSKIEIYYTGPIEVTGSKYFINHPETKIVEFYIYVGKHLIATECFSESEDWFTWLDRVEAATNLIRESKGRIVYVKHE